MVETIVVEPIVVETTSSGKHLSPDFSHEQLAHFNIKNMRRFWVCMETKNL